MPFEEDGVEDLPTHGEDLYLAVQNGLSQLGRTKDGLAVSFLRFELQDVPLHSSRQVAHLVHVQNLKLTGAGLSELEHLGSMSGLVTIDVSSNCLTEVLRIADPPGSLTHADLTHNAIATLAAPPHFPALRSLLLDHNPIASISDLCTALPSLEHLSLSHCALPSCSGLSTMTQLRVLDLTGNAVPSLEPLARMTRLERLHCAGNAIRDLAGLEGLESLRTLDLAHNQLGSHEALSSLRRLSQLSVLDVRGNDLTHVAHARLHVLFLLPQLAQLDGAPIPPQEKVDGANLHGADLTDLRAIRAHFFPAGELDDLGGAPPSLTTPLEAEQGDGADLVIPEALADRVAALVEEPGHGATGLAALALALQQVAGPSPSARLQAAYLWTTRCIRPPPLHDTWSVSCPLLTDALAPLERSLLPEGGARGAWSERVTALFLALLDHLQIAGLEGAAVHGTIRPRGFKPGDRLLMHNHCWAAVKVHDRWRLVDCALGSIPNLKWRFFTPPLEMCLTHMPLMNRWQLMGAHPRGREEFWNSPVTTPAYFSLQVGSPADPAAPPSLLCPERALFSLLHTAPAGTALFHELLDGALRPVLFDGSAGVPAGSFTFAHVLHSRDAAQVSPRRVSVGPVEPRDTWELWTSLPGPGEYFVRVSALVPSEGPEALEVITYRVVLGGSGAGGALLPAAHRQWLYTRCQLCSPAPGEPVVSGREVDVRICSPRPLPRPAVGAPGGHVFTPLLPLGFEEARHHTEIPCGLLLTYQARVRLPGKGQAGSFVITAESEDVQGVFAPLAHFKLVDDGDDAGEYA